MAARITAYLVACIVGVTLIAGLIVGAQRADDDAVDLIVINGKVYAGGGSEAMAEAVAIRGNKVVRVGSNRDIQRLRRAQTTIIDARGGAVMPGFNDAHAHFISGGLSLDQINLLDATTLDQIKDTVRIWSEAHPERVWITGRGWYYQPFAGSLPTRQLLDTLVPDRPAYLVAYDGHTGWANSKALKLAGITRHTRSPKNGVIVKDRRTGEPTGALKEAAMALMTAAPQPTTEDRIAAIRAGLVEAHRVGITSVQNAGGTAEDLELYDALRKRGELTLRVYQALSASGVIGEAELNTLAAVRERFGDDPLLKTGAVKLIADGVIESHTAAMLAPYHNQPNTSGDPRYTQEQLNKTVTLLDREGWQVMTHAIGDAAVRMTLDAYEAAVNANPAPERGRRHRVEHLETIDPADIPRFGKLGVIASMAPVHATPSPTPGDVWSTNIGAERAAHGWLWASIVKASGRLAFGSDWPVMTLDPLMGLQVAVNRTTVEGLPEGGWLPAERLSLRKAIDAYTSDASWASYDEQRKGVLARDMLADLVVMSDDIFEGPTTRITEAYVVVTIVDGKVVYRRDPPDTTSIQ
ncbi:MAG: amidohydrolase [Acidobacterium sp.]|nr:amidohydrolase [Acidobacteriota bacterium]PHY11479.1 MAG: amidohydrolase [Acidobacterium sp.]